MYIFNKQCETMHKNEMKQLKQPTSPISHRFSMEVVQNGPKLCKRKRRIFLRSKNSNVSMVYHVKVHVLWFQKM